MTHISKVKVPKLVLFKTMDFKKSSKEYISLWKLTH